MKANAVALVALFERKMRLEVPLFQRQYVWSSEQQWEPLWEDISRKFTEFLEGRSDAPVHFLGAIVLDQKQTPATHVERRMVIDGQQRLTTLQIFMAAFRDYCRQSGANALADECDNFTTNKGMMPDPDVDRYKVWPTKLDRQPFMDAVTCGSAEALELAYPLTWKKYARKPDSRPRIVDAYLFFYGQLSEFFGGTSTEPASYSEVDISVQLEECFQALRNALLVVAIDLEPEDDAQVIFETLNARGEPLLPADLLRNYIFLRASRQKEPQEELYKAYWEPFDDDFWREVVSQGRINRPRSDLLMQHYLASKQAIDIPIKHLYAEYRHWIEKVKPFSTVREELDSLRISRQHFRDILSERSDQPYSSLARFLQAFDIGTAYPLLLNVLTSGASKQEITGICGYIESYLLWRAVCGLTNKNLNRVFLTLTRVLIKEGVSASRVREYLTELRGESAEWPTKEAFFSSWMEADMYARLNNIRLRYILLKISDSYASTKSEDIQVMGSLTVEHLIPQEWVENWPLLDGSTGMDYYELFDAEIDDPRATATRQRSQIIQTFGNLTVLTGGLNSAASNAGWVEKKAEILRHVLLPVSLRLAHADKWSETEIRARGKDMFEKAIGIWPRA